MELKLFGYTITIDRSNTKEEQAKSIRRAYESGHLDKIQAVKEIRYLFMNTYDSRSFLKGAKDFVEHLR